jgi:hypothetical protein
VQIGASTITADDATNAQGASLTVTQTNSQPGPLSFEISVPSLGVNNLVLTDQGPIVGAPISTEKYTATSGSLNFEVDFSHYNFVGFGTWTVSNSGGGLTELSGFVTGYQAPNVQNLVLSYGSASFSGVAAGVVAIPDGTTWREATLHGNVSLTANFSTGTITGSLSSMMATPVAGGAPQAWNDVNLTASIARTSISGQTSAASSPAGSFALAGSASGALTGAFFGSTASEPEIGATWTLSDGVKSAIGELAAPFNQFFPGCSGTQLPGSPPCPPVLPSGSIGTNVGTASVGGPTLSAVNSGSAPPSTVLPADNSAFPLVQYVLKTTGQDVTEQPSVESQGGTLTIAHVDPTTGAATVLLSVPGLGVNAIPLIDAGVVSAGQPSSEIYGNNNGDSLVFSHLNYLAFGSWAVGGSLDGGAWVTGYVTPVSGVPTTGSANYAGKTYGAVSAPNNGGVGMFSTTLQGDAQLHVNFGNGHVTGSLTNMVAAKDYTGSPQPWNSVSLSGSLSGSGITGTTAATTAPGGQLGQSLSATGTLKGSLYGPTGEELGAVWTLFDGATHGASGVIATTRQAASDRRLKRGIEPNGQARNGVKLYRFRYLGDDRDFVGVMAQELLDDPDLARAVSQTDSGLLVVDYASLGLGYLVTPDMCEAGAAAIAAFETKNAA